MSAASSAPSATGAEAALATLYSVPVSNYSMRARYILRRKALSSAQVRVASPAELGGLKSPAYLALNPLGKMPLLVVHDDAPHPVSLFESRAICEYLADRFSDVAPPLSPPSGAAPELRAHASAIISLCDTYLGPLHPYMYKPLPEGGGGGVGGAASAVIRADGVERMRAPFDALEHIASEPGPYLCGERLSLADVALFGSVPFYDFILPTFFGVRWTDGRPKLAKWHAAFLTESDAARECYQEVWNGLEAWWDGGRWKKLGMDPVLSGKPVSPLETVKSSP